MTLSATASGTGTAAKAVLRDSDDNEVLTATVGGSVTISNASITSSQSVDLTAAAFTVPAGSDPVLVTAVRSDLADALLAAIDAGSGAGNIVIRTSGDSDLVEFTLNDPAGTVTNGVLTLDLTP